MNYTNFINEDDEIAVLILVDKMIDTIYKKGSYSNELFKKTVNVEYRTDMGKVAGRAWYRDNKIQLNAIMMAENMDEFMNETIPHEFAHLAVKYTYANAKQAHGPEFRAVCRQLGAQGTTYHRMDTVSSLRAKNPAKKLFAYACDDSCRTFNFTQIRHTKAKNGSNYLCTCCKKVLKFVEEV